MTTRCPTCRTTMTQLGEAHHCHNCGTLTWSELDTLPPRTIVPAAAHQRDHLQAELEKINAIARNHGYSQGELDDDLAGCIQQIIDRHTKLQLTSGPTTAAVDNIHIHPTTLGCSLVNNGHDDLYDLGFRDQQLNQHGLTIT